MKIKVFVSMLFAVVFLAMPLLADEYVYPNEEDPLFYVSMPDHWQVEFDDQLLSGVPEDESVYVAFWVLDAENMEEALDALDDVVDSFLDDFEADEAIEQEINGIPFLTVDGWGYLEDDTEVNVSVGLFLADDDVMCIGIYFGTEEAEALHEDELDYILGSIELAE